MKNRKLQPSVKTVQIASLSTILALSSGAFIHPAFAAGARENRVESRADMDARLGKDASAEGKLKLSETAERLGMQARDLSEFFQKQLKDGAADMHAWAKLLKDITPKARAAAADIAAADIALTNVRNYLEIRNSRAADNIEIREADLAEIQEKWSLEQKANFGKVLEKTVELVKSGKFATTEEAFEAALKAEGRYSKYRSCKI